MEGKYNSKIRYAITTIDGKVHKYGKNILYSFEKLAINIAKQATFKYSHIYRNGSIHNIQPTYHKVIKINFETMEMEEVWGDGIN